MPSECDPVSFMRCSLCKAGSWSLKLTLMTQPWGQCLHGFRTVRPCSREGQTRRWRSWRRIGLMQRSWRSSVISSRAGKHCLPGSSTLCGHISIYESRSNGCGPVQSLNAHRSVVRSTGSYKTFPVQAHPVHRIQGCVCLDSLRFSKSERCIISRTLQISVVDDVPKSLLQRRLTSFCALCSSATQWEDAPGLLQFPNM